MPVLSMEAFKFLTFLSTKTTKRLLDCWKGPMPKRLLSVAFAVQHKLIPVYATTRRDVVETRLPDGTVQIRRTFQHVRFRKYQYTPA